MLGRRRTEAQQTFFLRADRGLLMVVGTSRWDLLHASAGRTPLGWGGGSRRHIAPFSLWIRHWHHMRGVEHHEATVVHCECDRADHCYDRGKRRSRDTIANGVVLFTMSTSRFNGALSFSKKMKHHDLLHDAKRVAHDRVRTWLRPCSLSRLHSRYDVQGTLPCRLHFTTVASCA